MTRRRFGGRGATRTVFTVLWIALGGLSGFYLFTLFTNPTAAGFQLARPSPTMDAPAAPMPTAAPPPPPEMASSDISALEATLQGLSQRLADLDERLRPIENFIGPATKLPPSASVSTSLPKAQAEKPKPKPEPVVLAPAPVPKPTSSPEPEPAPLVEAAPAAIEPPAQTPTPAAVAPAPVAPEPAAMAPSPPPAPVVATPPELPAPVAVVEPPPPAAPPEPPAPLVESEIVEEEVEIAAYDPVTLPPSANDGSTRYGIEIGSVAKRDDLRPLWREYLTKHAALVAGLQPRRVLAPDKKWRLIAGPFANAQDAEGACSLFKSADRPCAATVYAGDAL